MNDARPPDGSQSSQEALLTELAQLRQENARLRQFAADPALHSRMAAIVESSDDAIVSKNLEGIIQTWNRGAERIFGWLAHEVIGKAINIIIPLDRQDEEPQILARIQRGERMDHFETIRMAKDGRLIAVSVTISPVRDGNGTIVAASKIARDITLQKQILRELQEAKEAAELANRAKDQFLSVLSHELRTPLTPVLAEMSYLEESAELPASIRGNIAMIRRNIETEARLVDDLLDLTRIARGKIQLHYESIDVNEAIRSVVAMAQDQIDEKALELAVGLRARKHHVWADAGRLQQVLLNLLSNAVKFTPEGGNISVRTSNEDEGNRLRIEVSDSGIGIPPETMPKLFTAFEQSERTRRLGGLGLGLSIARSLVDMHKGTIHAFSDGHDRGATFTVELATKQPEADRPTTALSIPGHAEPATGFRVLLVEDHADTRGAMTRLLKAIGCSVQAAGTVREAVELGEREDFDLLISDIGLPDGNGAEIMRRLRDRHIRGIALSGYGQEDDVARSREAGFETHITKPINFQTLRDAVQRYAAKS
jgi:PAS domain S-box-containing protein